MDNGTFDGYMRVWTSGGNFDVTLTGRGTVATMGAETILVLEVVLEEGASRKLIFPWRTVDLIVSIDQEEAEQEAGSNWEKLADLGVVERPMEPATSHLGTSVWYATAMGNPMLEGFHEAAKKAGEDFERLRALALQ